MRRLVCSHNNINIGYDKIDNNFQIFIYSLQREDEDSYEFEEDIEDIVDLDKFLGILENSAFKSNTKYTIVNKYGTVGYKLTFSDEDSVIFACNTILELALLGDNYDE